MAYDKEVINKCLVKIAKSLKVKDISEELNISLSTIYNWKKKYQKEIEGIRKSLKVRELANQKNYNEALIEIDKYIEESKQNGKKNYYTLASQKISLLISMKNYKQALIEANKYMEESKQDGKINYYILASQKISILISMGNYEISLIEVNKYIEESKQDGKINYCALTNQKVKVLNKINKNIIKNILVEKDFDGTKNQVSISILNDLNIGKISLEEINSSNIEDLSKIILTIAYYEKNNYSEKTTLNYLKQKINEYKTEKKVIKILNKLKERVINKRKIFDSNFYENIINSILDIEITSNEQIKLEKEYLNDLKEQLKNNNINQLERNI